MKRNLFHLFGRKETKDDPTVIAPGAYRDRTDLKSFAIPDGVTSIGDGAFWGCSNLTSITIPEKKATVTNPQSSVEEGYSLEYIQKYNGADKTRKPGSRTARYDQSLRKWQLTIQLDEAGTWFLSVFVKENGILEMYSLDEEEACDSHYQFRNESGLRQSIYAPGDENQMLDEVLIRYVQMYGGNRLVDVLRPFITAEFHFY